MHWFQVVSNICRILKLEYYSIFIYFKQSRLRVNLTCVSTQVSWHVQPEMAPKYSYWTELCFFFIFWFVKKLKQILRNIRYSNFKIQQIPNLLMKFQRNSKTNSKILDITLFLKYGFFKKLHHYECTSCQLTISSHQNMVGYLLHPPNFDDWKWSTDKRCIRNEVTS